MSWDVETFLSLLRINLQTIGYGNPLFRAFMQILNAPTYSVS